MGPVEFIYGANGTGPTAPKSDPEPPHSYYLYCDFVYINMGLESDWLENETISNKLDEIDCSEEGDDGMESDE